MSANTVALPGKHTDVTLYIAWSDAPLDESFVGPWSQLRAVADCVAFIDGDGTISRVYHELKSQLPTGAALLVVAADDAKFAGLRPGALAWLRRHQPMR